MRYITLCFVLFFLSSTPTFAHECEDLLWGRRVFTTDPPVNLKVGISDDSYLPGQYRIETTNLGDLILLTYDELELLPTGTVIQTVSGQPIIIGEDGMDLDIDRVRWTSEFSCAGFPSNLGDRKQMIEDLAPSVRRVVKENPMTLKVKALLKKPLSDNKKSQLLQTLMRTYLEMGQPHAAFPYLISYVKLRNDKLGTLVKNEINVLVTDFFKHVRNKGELKSYFKDLLRRSQYGFYHDMHPFIERGGGSSSNSFDKDLLSAFGIYLMETVSENRSKSGKTVLAVKSKEAITAVIEMIQDKELDQWLSKNRYDRIRILTSDYEYMQISFTNDIKPNERMLKWTNESLLWPRPDSPDSIEGSGDDYAISEIETRISSSAIVKLESLGLIDFGAIMKGGWPQMIAATLLEGLGFKRDIFEGGQLFYIFDEKSDPLKVNTFTKVFKALRLLRDNNFVVVAQGSIGNNLKKGRSEFWGVISVETYNSYYGQGIGNDLFGYNKVMLDAAQMEWELAESVRFVEDSLGYGWNGSEWIKGYPPNSQYLLLK